mmetsp:Transcript_58524/g.154387  ORF Transcript_58524/g.154387 Transcript_58524/m.154387 type:complete len:201 (-) Transcript_58524:3003-3605(-)
MTLTMAMEVTALTVSQGDEAARDRRAMSTKKPCRSCSSARKRRPRWRPRGSFSTTISPRSRHCLPCPSTANLRGSKCWSAMRCASGPWAHPSTSPWSPRTRAAAPTRPGCRPPPRGRRRSGAGSGSRLSSSSLGSSSTGACSSERTASPRSTSPSSSCARTSTFRCRLAMSCSWFRHPSYPRFLSKSSRMGSFHPRRWPT